MMKVLRQVQLFLQEGTSDKVYEIDLLEVSPGACVVNFRFGRRGTPLRDGTKTALAVEPAKAEKIFESLLAEKRGKGYREAGEAAAAGAKKPRGKAAETRQESSGRAAAMVLRRFDQRLPDGQLDRLIWRCGERRLAEALPRLLELLPKASGRLRRYGLAWAFGRIGDPRALPALEILSRDDDPPTAFIAANARQLLLEEPVAAVEVAARLSSWPPELAAAVSHGSEEQLAAVAEPWLAASHWENLPELYLADRLPAIRRLVLREAGRAPLQGAFPPLRRLFKAAELRCDGELFALLARRFDKEKARQSWAQGQRTVYLDFKPVKIADLLAKPGSAIGYTRRTRTYLRLRAARALRKLGELRDPAFLPMATSLLLSFTDQDAGTPRAFAVMDWETERQTTFYVDAWLIYWSLSFLLYQNSPRYEKKKRGGWRCQRNYKPGKAPPMVREEAFPELWDEAPEALFHLLERSRCAPVHEFAAKALAANRAFCGALDVPQLVTLIERPYEPTWQLGLRLAIQRWQAGPAVELLAALLRSTGSPARVQGLAWLAESPRFFAHPRVVLALLLSPHAELRRALADHWRLAPPAATVDGQSLLTEVLRGLLEMDPAAEGAGERAADAASAILVGFSAQLRQVDGELLGLLLGHPLAEVQQLAGRIVAEHLPLDRLTSDLVARLLEAESAAVRAQGVIVLSRLPLAELQDADEVLLAFCVAKESEIRQAARFLVRKLQLEMPSAAGRLATALSSRLLRADRPAGLHHDLLPILREDLAPSLPGLGRPMALRLLFARSAAAQEVGFEVLDLGAGWRELSIRELARLAQHEMAAVRVRSWETLEAEVARVRAVPTELIPAIDGIWADSRERGQRYFEDRFSGRDFDPVLLVALCDAVTPEARAFGREMLRRHFDGAEAETYLLRLAQHPSLDVQLFASGLLETHARGKPELLAQLLPFCGRVLARVYQGRAAKTRVLSFLHREGQSSEEAARLVLPLFENLSATIAIDDRAACLLALRDLRLAFPSLPSPLLARPAEERAG